MPNDIFAYYEEMINKFFKIHELLNIILVYNVDYSRLIRLTFLFSRFMLLFLVSSSLYKRFEN